MNFNYCPNCGYALIHSALASNPPIYVVECGRCGWMMREGRTPSWNTVSDSTDGTRINWQPQEITTGVEHDLTLRVPSEYKTLREEKE